MSIDLRERLNATLDSGQARGLHAAVVVRNGQIPLEHYGAGEDYSWRTSLGFVTPWASTRFTICVRSPRALLLCCTGSRSASAGYGMDGIRSSTGPSARRVFAGSGTCAAGLGTRQR